MVGDQGSYAKAEDWPGHLVQMGPGGATDHIQAGPRSSRIGRGV